MGGRPPLQPDAGMTSATTTGEAQDQEPVFRFLGDPATRGGAEVRRCDTHAAVVFLAGEPALKVKRAVRFPFLDYSSLDKRKAACVTEIEVNRRFAPQLYRRVVAITREAGGQLGLDGKGEAAAAPMHPMPMRKWRGSRRSSRSAPWIGRWSTLRGHRTKPWRVPGARSNERCHAGRLASLVTLATMC